MLYALRKIDGVVRQRARCQVKQRRNESKRRRYADCRVAEQVPAISAERNRGLVGGLVSVHSFDVGKLPYRVVQVQRAFCSSAWI